MRKAQTAFIVSFLLLFSGCVRTKISSQINREISDRHLNKILVVAPFKEPYREITENKLCDELNRLSLCKCQKSYYLFLPGEIYTDDEQDEILMVNEIDGILIFQQSLSVTESFNIIQKKRPSYLTYTIGNEIKEMSNDEYDFSRYWAKYVIILQSTLDSQIFWYAQASSSGNALSSMVDLIKASSIEIVKRLIDDGMIPSRKK